MDFCEVYILLMMLYMIHFKEVSAFSSVFSSFFFLSKMVVQLHKNASFWEVLRLVCTFSTDECGMYMAEKVSYGSLFLERGLHCPWHGLCCEMIPGDSKSRQRPAVSWAPLPGHTLEPKAMRFVWAHQARSVLCSGNILERAASSQGFM